MAKSWRGRVNTVPAAAVTPGLGGPSRASTIADLMQTAESAARLDYALSKGPTPVRKSRRSMRPDLLRRTCESCSQSIAMSVRTRQSCWRVAVVDLHVRERDFADKVRHDIRPLALSPSGRCSERNPQGMKRVSDVH